MYIYIYIYIYTHIDAAADTLQVRLCGCTMLDKCVLLLLYFLVKRRTFILYIDINMDFFCSYTYI